MRFRILILHFLCLLIILNILLIKPVEADVMSGNTYIPQADTKQSIKSVPSIKRTSEVNKSPYIIIDPGHGGNDLGTVSGNLFEKNINLDISNRLKSLLQNNGYKVTMTRTKDVFLASRSSIEGTEEKKDLDARTCVFNSSNASLFISIHVDSLPSDTDKNGSAVYYSSGNKDSNTLAYLLQSELNLVTVNGVKRDKNLSSTADFYILKNSDIPGVLVETGFLTNKLDKQGFLQDKFKDDIAKAIFNGIQKYSNKNYVMKLNSDTKK